MTAVCTAHPVEAAGASCSSCGHLLCGDCVRVSGVRGRKLQMCGKCGGPVFPLHRSQLEPRSSFLQALPASFAYPFVGSGKAILLAGGLFFGACHLVTSFAGIFGAILAVFVGGYFTAYMFRIVQSTANGEHEPPDWPDFSDMWDSVLLPMFHMIAGSLIGFVPLLIYFYAADSVQLEIALGLGAVGLLYCPMAILLIALFGSVSSAHPLMVIPAVCKIPLSYLLTCGFLGLAIAIEYAANSLLSGLPILGIFVGAFVSLYFALVEMRMIGLLYFLNEDKLGWFRRRN